MDHIVGRYLCDGTRDISKNLGEQFEIEVHVNRLARIGVADALQNERETATIEVRIETGIAIERANYSLSGYSRATSALAGNGFVMAGFL